MATPSLPTHVSQLTHRHSLFIVILCSITLTLFTLFWFTAQLSAADNTPDTPTVMGSIAGTVRDTQGAPVTGITVTLWAISPYYFGNFWLPVRMTAPEADGSYRFNALPPGVYRVGASDSTAHYGNSFYPTTSVVQEAQDIPIAGNTVTGIDLVVQPAGRIVVSIATTPEYTLTTAYFNLHQRVEIGGAIYWEIVQSFGILTSSHVYTFTGLAPNLYRACAYGYGPTVSTYECYDNVYALRQATNLTLTAGSTISNVVITLGDGANFAQIKGQVTASDGQPLAGIQVYALPLRTDSVPIAAAHQQRVAQMQSPFAPQSPADDYYGYLFADTDAAGNYQLSTLPVGKYRLKFTDPSGSYAFEYYNNSLFEENGAVYELAARQVLTGFNGQLDPGARISGQIMLQGQPASETTILAELKRPDGNWTGIAQIKTNPNTGRYSFGGLPAGSYRISAQAQLSWNYPASPPYGVYGGANLTEATEIVLNTGNKRENIDITLNGQPFEGSLSGRITANGAPLAGAKVTLYNRNTFCCNFPSPIPFSYSLTDAAGNYTFKGLTYSELVLEVSDPAGIWATTYYSGAVTGLDARPIRVDDTQVVTKMDVDLPLAGAISGVVRQMDGTPVSGLHVLLHWRSRRNSSTAVVAQDIRTDETGRYRVAGLQPGDYHVCFTTDPYYSPYYGIECYGTLGSAIHYDPLASPVVTVTAGKTTENTDLYWGAEPNSYLPLIAR